MTVDGSASRFFFANRTLQGGRVPLHKGTRSFGLSFALRIMLIQCRTTTYSLVGDSPTRINDPGTGRYRSTSFPLNLHMCPIRGITRILAP